MKLENFDLDVKNATKDFPQDEQHSFLYLSGTSDENTMDSFMLCSGTAYNLCDLLHSSMINSSGFHRVVLSAASIYLKENPQEMVGFLIETGAMVQNKDMN